MVKCGMVQCGVVLWPASKTRLTWNLSFFQRSPVIKLLSSQASSTPLYLSYLERDKNLLKHWDVFMIIQQKGVANYMCSSFWLVFKESGEKLASWLIIQVIDQVNGFRIIPQFVFFRISWSMHFWLDDGTTIATSWPLNLHNSDDNGYNYDDVGDDFDDCGTAIVTLIRCDIVMLSAEAFFMTLTGSTSFTRQFLKTILIWESSCTW